MRHYNSELFKYTDKDTGAEVTRLTGYRCNSNHLYFTNNCFYDNATKIVFESDRGNALNFYSLDLITGEIDQLTDLKQPAYPNEFPLHEAFVDSVKGNCCFFYDNILYRLSLKDGSLTPIYHIPEGFFHHIVSISPDGEYVYTSIIRYPLDRSDGDLPLIKVLRSNPVSRLLRIPINGGPETVILEEQSFIAHVNISPTDPDMLTFCHEGPWSLVDNRLWSIDLKNHIIRKLHPCEKDEVIGHEYWYADGHRIGYHGIKNNRSIIGVMNGDGSDDRTYDFPYTTGHIFSQDEKLIVGDGDDGIFMRIWRLLEEGYEAPRALCAHKCTFKRQRAHVHPRITPDGKSVLYTSDETGYEQLYLVRLPENLQDLPFIESLAHLGAR